MTEMQVSFQFIGVTSVFTQFNSKPSYAPNSKITTILCPNLWFTSFLSQIAAYYRACYLGRSY